MDQSFFQYYCQRTPRQSHLAPLVLKGGSARGPPRRDKGNKSKFNLGASLEQHDQLRVLAMLDQNVDRFAFSLEDVEPEAHPFPIFY